MGETSNGINYKSIIILGYKRSGTSLLRVILNSHPDIAIGPEIKFMQRVTKSYPNNFEQFKKVTKQAADDFRYSEETLKKLFDTSSSPEELMENWCVEYRNITGKKIWGDKTPQNFKYLKLLGKKFPDALYVHIVRHPFDVIKSSIKRGEYNGVKTVLAWLVSNTRIRYVSNKHYFFFKYEDFIKDPNKYVFQVFEKLGVEKIDLLSTYQNYDHGRMAEGDSWKKPVYNANINNKEQSLSLKDKLLVKILCFSYLKKYGYKT